MAQMAQKNDDKIMTLKAQVENKRAELGKMPSVVRPTTNCQLEIGKEQINIRVESTTFLLVRLNAYAMAAKDLGINPDEVILSGYTLNQWIQDVRDFLQVQKYREEKRKLNDLEKSLNSLLSDDKRTELEIDRIAAMLK